MPNPFYTFWRGIRSESLAAFGLFRRVMSPAVLRHRHIWISSAFAVSALLWSGWTVWAPEPTKARTPVDAEREKELPLTYQLVATPPPPLPTPNYQAVREIPRRWARNTKRPAGGEGSVSGSIDDVPFDPDRDLIRVDDARVWWESDHDAHENDVEEDRIMHWALEDPFRRLVELVEQHGGHLKVQDAYRAEGIHARKSLHKQGRAIDITDFNLPLSKLAALTWAAGFDWVYYENHHVHASVNIKGKIRRTFEPADHEARH